MEYKVLLAKDILEENRDKAEENRLIFKSAGVKVVNLLSSPGAGKTTLLETTIKELTGRLKIGVIEGDPETALDAERLARFGVPVVQINTTGGCHLDALMIKRAMAELPLSELDLIFIENVGNLVCPASFDLGEDIKVVLLSVPEGSDKPPKYPAVFHKAGVLVVTKIDLLPYTNFSLDAVSQHLNEVNPEIKVLPVSATAGEGLEAWYKWLEEITS